MNAIDKQIRAQKDKEERRQRAIKSMEKVLAIESGTPERWRAAYNHFFIQRPEAKDDAELVAEGVRTRRKDMDKFASTKHGRMAYSTPEWLLPLLKQTDPEYFANKSAHDFNGMKHLKLMKEAFPQFFYPEVI